ncbi:YcaQ family DNA glycosylase [bacterium]|nr:YcaQ family DNA glycosylase [bacterium]
MTIHIRNMNIALKSNTVTIDQARQLILYAQRLDAKRDHCRGLEGVRKTIQHLGYVQIDTIAVVQRAHHHVLWTRCPDYNTDNLHQLQAVERSIFEYWGHAMSYLPMEDYRFFLPRMQNFKNPSSPWAVYQHQKAANIVDDVLKRVRKEGPLSSKDFKSESGHGGTWWDWKPAKAALELLFWRGDLMISQRRNFQKVYDLRERILPSNINITMPTPMEVGHFLVHRALNSLGIATEREILKFMQPDSARDSDWLAVDKAVVKRCLIEQLEEGEAIKILIDGDDKTINYTTQKLIDRLSSANMSTQMISILSPFDNLIIQRKRIQRLFGFDYTLECYMPQAKRKIGYFVLPILRGTHFIARMDAKADKRTGTLIIHLLHFEDNFVDFDAIKDELVQVINQFAKFNGCSKICINRLSPKGFNIIRILHQGKI